MAGIRRRSLICVAALAPLILAAPAEAKTFVVTKLGDPAPNGCGNGGCSLREAVIAANARSGPDAIELPKAKTYRLAVANTAPDGEDAALEGDLDVTGALRVAHLGKGRAKIDAREIDRVFDVFAPTRFSKVVITGGDVDDYGGGIRAEDDVQVLRSAVVRNHSTRDGGGISFPDAGSSLLVTRSSISRNVSDDDGGGVGFDSSGGGVFKVTRSRFVGNRSDDWGGGFISAVTAKISNSTFAGNRAMGGTGGGGSLEEPDDNVVRNTTFSGNRADADGGGLDVSGGADARLVNVTIADNSAGDAGGGLKATDGAVSMNAVSVVRNEATDGGGIAGSPADVVRVANSMIALNDATGTGPDCFADGDDFRSRGHNLLSTAAGCDGFDKPSDLERADPKVQQLARNGGPTKTVALKPGSPAIGEANRRTAPKSDQRGRKRDRRPDIGAFER